MTIINTSKIATIIFLMGAVVVLFYVMGQGINNETVVHCLKLKSQANEFSHSYANWAKENPDQFMNDVKGCKQYDVEIVLN